MEEISIVITTSMNLSQLASHLTSHVATLCASERNTGNCPEGLERAATYLAGAFQGLDYQVSRQEFGADGVLCANVEALTSTFVGYDKPHYIIGAPADSCRWSRGEEVRVPSLLHRWMVSDRRLLKDLSERLRKFASLG